MTLKIQNKIDHLPVFTLCLTPKNTPLKNFPDLPYENNLHRLIYHVPLKNVQDSDTSRIRGV